MSAKEKILIVDDEKDIVKLLEYNLKKEGFRTVTAYDGNEALEKAGREHPDLILLDVMLPEVDGLEVCKQIKKDPATRTVPVIMLTGFGDIALIIKSIQLGAFDFLEKPINTPQLKEVVASALNSVISSKKHDQVLTEGISIDKKIQENILIGRSPQIKDIFKNIGRVSLNKVNILIEGESGTGKELIARLIHYSGITRDKPLVVVNCSALTETLLESELFGHEKGSFTGSAWDHQV